jgi:hypothetical protein
VNAVVADAIATETAALTRTTATPSAPFGYGADISCTRDLDESMPEVSGQTALAQALARRLDCPRGGVPDDGDYGIDLRGYLNRGLTTDEVRGLAGAIRSELTKDDRVDTLRVTVTPTPTGESIRVSIQVVPRDPTLGGPFTLTLALTDGGALVEEMTR